MNRGYVKLWRKSLDAGWIKNHKLWVFWSYCLLKASYKEYDAIVGLQIVHLMPGQFIFGLLVASEETGLTIRQIRTLLTFLINAGNVTIKTTNKFSIISIINWHTYQSHEDENDTLNDKQLTNKAQHTRSKERKKEITLSDSRTSESFNFFYKAYPKHEGKQPALKVWNKLNPDPSLCTEISAALEKQKIYKASLKKSGQFCPDWPLPATWLSNRRWEDETPIEASQTAAEGYFSNGRIDL